MREFKIVITEQKYSEYYNAESYLQAFARAKQLMKEFGATWADIYDPEDPDHVHKIERQGFVLDHQKVKS